MMNWNKNDTKYILKRLILYFLITGIVFFAGQRCAHAATLAPSTLQYYKPDRVNAWTRSPVNNNLLNENYYNTSVGDPNEIRAIYGIANNQISGSLFSFSLLKGQPVPTISAKIQFVDASWFNCDLETDVVNYADGSIYVAKCDLSGTGSKQVYKYGFEWSDSSGYYMSENSVYISKINAFSDANAYASYITNVNNNINTVNTQLTDIKYQNERIINAEVDTKNAIDAQTQWQQQNFTSDTSQVSAITDLISTGDKNQIRDLLMFPARILMIVGGHIGADYCYAFNLGSLYGTNLVLPCINWKQYVGNDLYNTIDVILSIGIYIGLVIYIRKLLDYVFSLGNTGFNSVNVEVFN